MHAVSQSLAHRGAIRNGARWHPYISPRSSGGSISTIMHADFPDSSTLPTIHTPTPVPTVSLTTSLSPEDRSSHGNPQRAKYLVNLLDQAVRSLSEVWQPKFIPPVFTVPVVNTMSNNSPITCTNVLPRQFAQLPSPISPMTQPSPPQTQTFDTTTPSTGLVPLKGFVHEVLRRSRTSATALQTALCYIEAVRARIPELYEQDSRGEANHIEPDLSIRIVMGVENGEDDLTVLFESDGELLPLGEQPPLDDKPEQFQPMEESVLLTKKRKVPSAALAPLPPLPTPLLCPRRTFLAALILASKFTQDKCYSNRAWAKLSGLPAREIGRCERALGDALEWRLWVGKNTGTSTSPGTDGASTQALGRCRSEGDLKFKATPRPAISYMPSPPTSEAGSPEFNRASAPRSLGRSTTAPAITFNHNSSVARATASGHAVSMSGVVSSFCTSTSTRGYEHVLEHGGISPRAQSTPESTPTLICSPSSIGERTVLVNAMGSFTDDIKTPLNSFWTPVDSGNCKMEPSSWPMGYSTAGTFGVGIAGEDQPYHVC